MKPMNIISACNSSNLEIEKTKLTEEFKLSNHESRTLGKFIDLLKEYGADPKCFSGYYISYSIKQISKEFDLLKFCEESVINIELKSQLNEQVKHKKISDQMVHNHYYLKFLDKNVIIYTYVENDGLYTFNHKTKQADKADVKQLVELLKSQNTDYSLCPDNLFIPRNYLISAFNNTERFLDGEYFLTDHQVNIKKEILEDIEKGQYKIYCIPANAGTGKTLLAYDIARHMIDKDCLPIIVHCGKLNDGHLKLKNSRWNIEPVKIIRSSFLNRWNDTKLDIIIVDESQRISLHQLNLIINKSYELKIPVVFMYDTKQYLKTGENTDVFDYIKDNNKNIPLIKRKLTNKIRTNKKMASFIKNLIHIGSSKANLDYKDITIEYFNRLNDVSDYIDDLTKNNEWKAITFTTSLRYKECLDNISNVCNSNAHDVIGQEFRKVVFVMDSNFRYDENNRLMIRRTYYSGKGMLYQIVTRVVEELKIIVLDNPNLFVRLLEVKHNSFSKTK